MPMNMLPTTLVIVHRDTGVLMVWTDQILLVIILQSTMHLIIMTLVHTMTEEKQAMEVFVQLDIIALKVQRHHFSALQDNIVLFQSSVKA